MSVLVTGGTGYIGSHIIVELLNSNCDIIIVDNLSNSTKDIVKKIEIITKKRCKFYEDDIRDKKALEKIFGENEIDSVIHCAGLKSIRESVEKPIEYYNNNVIGTINLLETMIKYNCKKFIFSSSASIYGNLGVIKYVEDMGRSKATSPYGATKATIEEILENLYVSDSQWKISILRYFNPIGAHESGMIGDNPKGAPNNLMPFIQKVAKCELEQLTIFGNGYDTKDGTGVRDYIHVTDLAKRTCLCT